MQFSINISFTFVLFYRQCFKHFFEANQNQKPKHMIPFMIQFYFGRLTHISSPLISRKIILERLVFEQKPINFVFFSFYWRKKSMILLIVWGLQVHFLFFCYPKIMFTASIEDFAVRSKLYHDECFPCLCFSLSFQFIFILVKRFIFLDLMELNSSHVWYSICLRGSASNLDSDETALNE